MRYTNFSRPLTEYPCFPNRADYPSAQLPSNHLSEEALVALLDKHKLAEEENQEEAMGVAPVLHTQPGEAEAANLLVDRP